MNSLKKSKWHLLRRRIDELIFFPMKRKSSPIFKSLKCSNRNSQVSPFQKNAKRDQTLHSQNLIQDVRSSDSLSTNDSQESNLTTQNTQSFKTRLEKRFSELSPSTSLIESKPSSLEISFESCSSSNVDIGPFFGLPSRIRDLILHSKNIKKLYDWQVQCLQMGLNGTNLLISLPTSSGKTLVAEILILRQVLLYQKNALFVLPYISLVQEKVRNLCSLAVDLNFVVAEYAGSKGIYPPKERRRRNTIYVATLEKANSLIDSFLETNRLAELGIVVVDEVHMLSETGGRGAKLEMAIAKLRYFSVSLQLVAMSATVGNLDELASFLNASLYRGEFRPVPLTQYLKVENKILLFNDAVQDENMFELITENYNPMAQVSKVDHDRLAPIVEEIIPEHSCLVFCPTRANAEAVAKLICQSLSKGLYDWCRGNKMALIFALKEEGSGTICPVLRRTVPYGVAYHHSGLTEGERKLIEEAFIMGTLCCIVCTSTLAAGVNLPARRVLIKAPYVGKDFITKSQYSQMIGRAGRAGLDSVGESFMIVSPQDVVKVRELLVSPIEKCTSRLVEKEAKGLTELLFSMIGLQMIKSISSALRLVEKTLLAIQAKVLEVDVHAQVLAALEKLRSQGMLRCQKEENQELRRSPRASKKTLFATPDKLLEVSKLCSNQRLVVCRVGKAAIKGSINLRWANRLYHDLVTARCNLVVHSHLHLLYLVIPYDSSETFSFNPQIFFSIFNKLNEEEREVASLLGITEARAIRIRMGEKPKDLDMLVVRRFCMALLLHSLLKGTNIWEVSDLFGVDRGLTQRILATTVSFAHGVLYFCKELEELWAFRDLLLTFTKTLSICSYSEITTLLSLPAVKFGRAKLMFKAGFKDLTEIAKATPQQLAASVNNLSHNVAGQIISSAKMLLLEKANDLKEEAEDILLYDLPVISLPRGTL